MDLLRKSTGLFHVHLKNLNGNEECQMSKRISQTIYVSQEDVRIQEFLDMIAPSVVKFNADHFICGNTYRCVWALREYQTATEEQAILRHLGEKDGITLRIYTRHVTPVEEKKIISNAANKNRMNQSNTNDLQQTVLAESNLQDVATIVAQMHRNREPLLHAAVYLELSVLQISINLIIRARRITTVFMLAEINSAAMCWSISIREPMTKPMLISLFLEIVVRVRAIC
jgi:hypothetical protein